MMLMTKAGNRGRLTLGVFYVCFIYIISISVAGGFIVEANVSYVDYGDSVYMECKIVESFWYMAWRPPWMNSSEICGPSCNNENCPDVIITCVYGHPDILLLLIPKVTDDSYFGSWTCVYVNRVEERSLNIYKFEKPSMEFSWEPDMLESEVTTFTCKTTGGEPSPSHQWYVMGQMITPNEGQTNESGIVTSIHRMRLARDTYGTVECQALQLPHKSPVVECASIDVKYAPTLYITPVYEPYYVQKGDDLVLSCNKSGGNPSSVTYTWIHDGNDLAFRDVRLAITNFDEEHEGVYTCSVNNTAYDVSASRTVALKLVAEQSCDLSDGEISAIAICVFTFVLLIIAIVYLAWRLKQMKKIQGGTTDKQTPVVYDTVLDEMKSNKDTGSEVGLGLGDSLNKEDVNQTTPGLGATYEDLMDTSKVSKQHLNRHNTEYATLNQKHQDKLYDYENCT